MQTRCQRQIVQPGVTARRGVTLVETAIVLSTFAVMMLGMLELGLAVLRQNSLDAAARHVARDAIVRGAMAARGTAWGPASYRSHAAATAEIPGSAREPLIAVDPRDVTVAVDWPDGGNQPEQRVRVRCSYRHETMFPLLLGRNLDLRSECVMRIAH